MRYLAVRVATETVADHLFKQLDALVGSDPDRLGEPGTDRTSPYHLRWMAATVAERAHEWPLDKLSRWLGFVQGIMAARGLLDVDEERDRTRPIFEAAYKADAT